MELLLKNLLLAWLTTKRFTNKAIHLARLKLGCCDLCLGQELQHALLCRHCLADLPYFHFEKINHNLLNWPAINKLFPKRAFDQLFCLAPYIWPFDLWIKQLKYQNRFELATLLAQLLHDNYCFSGTNKNKPLILSIPIHFKKWQIRGFNQAHLIAKAFSHLSQIPYDQQVLTKNVFSNSQVGQNSRSRRKSLKGTFSVNWLDKPIPKQVILIDDVITTGSTVNEIATLLKEHGVHHITVITVAITLPK